MSTPTASPSGQGSKGKPLWIFPNTGPSKKLPIAIGLAIAYAAFYHLTPYIGLAPQIIIAMFVLSPLFVISMVYVILKHGQPSPDTFAEKFYEDRDEKRFGVK